MIFHETPLKGAFTIDLEKKGDERGFFARMFDTKEFADHGLETSYPQINNSLSRPAGTLRGVHYQLAPHAEVKVVRCVRGKLYDVILDLRPDSPTFGKHFGAELSAENRTMMYVPRGFGHAFITLEDDTEAIYLVSTPYAPQAERGVRWNDPKFNIRWPREPAVLSDKDRGQRDFDPAWHLGNADAGKQ